MIPRSFPQILVLMLSDCHCSGVQPPRKIRKLAQTVEEGHSMPVVESHCRYIRAALLARASRAHLGATTVEPSVGPRVLGG